MLKYRLINGNEEYAVVGYNKDTKLVKTVEIPKTHQGKKVTKIDDFAFKDCSSLKSITIPDSVTSVGESTFKFCYKLKSITIPNSVTAIGENTFYSCYSLENVTILNSVTSIEDYAFNYCHNLKNVPIPDSVTYIGEGAFHCCYELTTKKANYKAFKLVNGELKCKDMVYKENELATVNGRLGARVWGIHYCTNLFEVFDYYSGKLDEDFAIYECEVLGDVRTTYTSLCCTNKLIPRKKLSKKEIIDILNNKE